MKYFPVAVILLFSGATIEAAWCAEWRLAIFYACSAIINCVVRF